MPSTIPSDDNICSAPQPIALVLPRPVFNCKGTRSLRRMIRRQQREAAFQRVRVQGLKAQKKALRRANREAKQAALSLQRTLNCNQPRNARPVKGAMKDRENSDPTDGEDEDCFVTTTTTTTTVTTTTTKASKRPARVCRKARRSLADVEHSAGSDDEDRVLPNFHPSAVVSDRDVIDALLRLAQCRV